MIEKLTEEQQELLLQFRDEWLKIGRSTEPVDFEKAHDAIGRLYEWGGYDKPKFVDLQSPLQCELFLNIVNNKEVLDNLTKFARDGGYLWLPDEPEWMWRELRNIVMEWIRPAVGVVESDLKEKFEKWREEINREGDNIQDVINYLVFPDQYGLGNRLITIFINHVLNLDSVSNYSIFRSDLLENDFEKMREELSHPFKWFSKMYSKMGDGAFYNDLYKIIKPNRFFDNTLHINDINNDIEDNDFEKLRQQLNSPNTSELSITLKSMVTYYITQEIRNRLRSINNSVFEGIPGLVDKYKVGMEDDVKENLYVLRDALKKFTYEENDIIPSHQTLWDGRAFLGLFNRLFWALNNINGPMQDANTGLPQDLNDIHKKIREEDNGYFRREINENLRRELREHREGSISLWGGIFNALYDYLSNNIGENITEFLDGNAVEQSLTDIQEELNDLKPDGSKLFNSFTDACYMNVVWTLINIDNLGTVRDQVTQSDGALREAVAEIREKFADSPGPYSNVWKQFHEAIEKSTDFDMDDQMLYDPWAYAFSLFELLGVAIFEDITGMVKNSLREFEGMGNEEFPAEFGNVVRDELWNEAEDICDIPTDSDMENLMFKYLLRLLYINSHHRLSDQLSESISKMKFNYHGTWFNGQEDAYWVAFYLFGEEIGVKYEDRISKGLHIWEDICKSSYWFYPFKEVCLVSARPKEINLDSEGRLHSLAGPAMSFPDGYSIYSVHGVRLPAYIITDPQQITVEKIREEQNAEIRRIMVDQYGQDRYLVDAGAQLIHSDTFGDLYRMDMVDDEPIVMVKVINRTAEPDGTYREFFLRIHPECRPLLNPSTREFGEPQELTARNAVASTWGLRGEEYSPDVET